MVFNIIVPVYDSRLRLTSNVIGGKAYLFIAINYLCSDINQNGVKTKSPALISGTRWKKISKKTMINKC